MKHIDRFSPPRRSPCFGMPLAGATVGLLLFGVLAVLGMGCASSSATRDTADADKSVVMVTGLQPDWTLDEMVRRSDAVVLGTVQESLGSNRHPGPAAGGDIAKYEREYRDFKLTIETAYHPSTLSGSIAGGVGHDQHPGPGRVMTGPYPVQSDPNIRIDTHSDIPHFAVNDRVLVFLDSLNDHKSSSKRFDGHKAAIVVDTDTQLITAVEVLPGNAPDNSGALELVEQSETNTGVTVEEAMGDAAYGDGDTRQAFADAGRTLIARVPGRPNRTHFPKEDFRIDLEAGSCTCPAGNVTRTMAPAGWRTGQTGRTYRLEAFRFDAAVCGVCPLRPRCVAAKPGTGRTVQLHPQEGLLQQARALQQSEAFAEYRERRVVVEHRLARLVQLGIRQSRYFGRIKTRFQLYLAATVANLTLVASKAGMTGEPGSGPSAGSPQVAGMVNSAANAATAWLGQIWTLSLLVSALLTKSLFPIRGFRPGF